MLCVCPRRRGNDVDDVAVAAVVDVVVADGVAVDVDGNLVVVGMCEGISLQK